MPAKKKSAARKTARVRAKSPAKAKSGQLWSLTPLAALSESVIFDCLGDTVVALNPAGKKLLGAKGVGYSLAQAFAAETSLKALVKGPQPKSMVLIDWEGRRRPVDVSAKPLGGAGVKARAVVIATLSAAKTTPARGAAKSGGLDTASSLTAQILGAASNGIVALDLQGVITLANPAAADMLNRDAGAMKGMAVERAFVHGSSHAQAGKPVPIKAQLQQGSYHVDQEVQLARSDGESFDAVYSVVPLTANKRTAGYVITFRDIKQRRRADAEMRLAAVVFDHSPEGVIVADAKGRVTKINPAYRRIAGSEEREVLGKQLSDILFTETKGTTTVLDMLQGSDQTQWEQWCKATSGRRYAARISVSVVRDHDGSIQQYVAIMADVTRRKLDEEKIIYQANYDQLTSLPNRTLFMDRLTRLVLESRRAKTSIGLMFIDLDGFKAINDTLGHDAGDELLKSTARRLEKCVREADTVARLGGDEFTVIMPLIDNFDAAGFVAGRIIKSLSEPFDLRGSEGRVSASIGISLLPAQASTAGELLHNADVAMYHAKLQGKANYQFYAPELAQTVKVKERDLG